MESNFQDEEWRKCVLDETLLVSNLGRAMSIDRLVPMAHGAQRMARGKLLKPHILSTGYAQIHGANRRKLSLHRMIAATFLQADPSRTVVNHKNGVKADNRAENLEWVTPSENLIHAYRELGATVSCKGKFGARHPTSKAVIATSLATGHEKEYASAQDAIRELGASSSGISRCCAGMIAHHKGYKWRFNLGAQHNVKFRTDEGMK